jgi:hypothetical protein
MRNRINQNIVSDENQPKVVENRVGFIVLNDFMKGGE